MAAAHYQFYLQRQQPFQGDRAQHPRHHHADVVEGTEGDGSQSADQKNGDTNRPGNRGIYRYRLLPHLWRYYPGDDQMGKSASEEDHQEFQ